MKTAFLSLALMALATSVSAHGGHPEAPVVEHTLIHGAQILIVALVLLGAAALLYKKGFFHEK